MIKHSPFITSWSCCIFAAAFFSLLTLQPAFAQNTKIKTAETTELPPGEAVVYKTVDGKNLNLYITKPDDTSPPSLHPAILYIHGGAWIGGSPDQFVSHAEHFRTRGVISFHLQYRLLSKNEKNVPPEICIEDARDAITWIFTHADEYHIDTQKIAAGGGSAGGHLAAVLGMIDVNAQPFPYKPHALLLFNPVYDNGPDGGWGTARVGQRYPEFSPAHNISSDDPPTLVQFGDHDKLVAIPVAQRFQEKMKDAGVRSDLIIYEDQGHGFFNKPPYDLQVIQASDDFLTSLGWLPPVTIAP